MSSGLEGGTVPLPLASRLLRQAIQYALASADLVTPALLAVPTPCAGWTLGLLLSHLSESLDALCEGLTQGEVRLAPPACAAPGPEPASMRAGCARLLAAISAVSPGRLVAIAGHDMADGMLASAGAIEVAVHGWDISAACGRPRPIPPDLAAPLLCAVPVLVPAGARSGLFAAPLPPPAGGTEADCLLAYLGRDSGQW
jgi:uncharacterized protein (TIGR03086 family)